MPWINKDQPTIAEKAAGGLSYLTLGLAGLLFIIISQRHSQSQFFRFHFLQSIIVGIIALILSWASNIFTALASGLISMLSPILGALAPEAGTWLGWAVTIIVNAFNLLLLYGMIWCFLGKFAEIPFISNMVRSRM